MLFNWETNGLESAAKRFSAKNSSNLNLNAFVENLRGNISFISELRGAEDNIVVKKYQTIFQSLSERDLYKEDICHF